MAPHKSKSAKRPSDGSHFASQVIHSSSKLASMMPKHLMRIGRSSKFQDLVVAVSKEANKELKPVLERAVKACIEGQNETVKIKKHRKRQILIRIEGIENKRKRVIARQRAKARATGQHNQQREGRLLVATIEADSDENVEDDDDDDNQETTDSLPTKYERQLALVRGEPLPVDKNHCLIHLAQSHASTRINFDPALEFEEILTSCIIKLEPEAVRDALGAYLRDRLESRSMLNPPLATEHSSIEEILDVLQALNRYSEDAMIRCASAQMLLYFSVTRQVLMNSNNHEIAEGGHRAAHLNILQNLAVKKAGGISQKEVGRMYKSYEKDYHAGKKWVEIADMFGGDAAVILFVVAEVGPWYVTKRFTEYQRECLLHLSSHLIGIRILVEALGSDILKRYCRRGYLDQDVVDFIEVVGLSGA